MNEAWAYPLHGWAQASKIQFKIITYKADLHVLESLTHVNQSPMVKY